MKIAITSAKEIVAKKSGITYLVVEGFSSKGTTVKAFLDPDQLGDFQVPEAVSKEDFAELFNSFPQADIEFNDIGRVEGISE